MSHPRQADTMAKPLKQTNFKQQLSTIRHDMRTSVGHIIGYSEILEEDLDGETAKKYSGDLQTIQNAGNKILAIIDDYMGASIESVEEINFTDAQYKTSAPLSEHR